LIFYRFRWVECQLSTLKHCITLSDVRETLKELPKTLDDTYARILKNIPEKYSKRAHCAMQILVVSYRPLSPVEVADAIAVDHENEKFDPTVDRLLDPLDILQICSSLVMVRSNEYSLLTT